MSCNDYDFLTLRISATEAQIAAYEDAALSLSSGGIQQYMIDTGQTKQSVTKVDIKVINDAIDGLYNRRATLYARRDGCGVTIAGAGW